MYLIWMVFESETLMSFYWVKQIFKFVLSVWILTTTSKLIL